MTGTGPEPEVWDPGLQLERTSLAWQRLGLAILGIALTSLRFTWPMIGAWAMLPTGVIVVGGAAVLVGGNRRYQTMHERLGQRRVLPDGRLLFATVLVVVAVAVLALLIVIGPA